MTSIQDYIFKMTKGRFFADKTFEENRTIEDFQRDYISSTRASLDYAYLLGSIGR